MIKKHEQHRETDIEIMKKYNIQFNQDSICFTESLFRMELTDTTQKIKLTYKGSDIFGKATKRVLCNPKSDIPKKDLEVLEKIQSLIKNSENKEYRQNDVR